MNLYAHIPEDGCKHYMQEQWWDEEAIADPTTTGDEYITFYFIPIFRLSIPEMEVYPVPGIHLPEFERRMRQAHLVIRAAIDNYNEVVSVYSPLTN